MAIVQSVSVFPATTTVVASTFAGLCSTAEVLNKKESREERVEENTLGRKRGHEVAEDEKVSKRPKSLYPSSEERPSQNVSYFSVGPAWPLSLARSFSIVRSIDTFEGCRL